MKAKFDGPWLDLLEITLKNLILRIITLGFYHPWARVNVRRFMWRHTMLDGERFEFTGDGKELFIGFIKFGAGLLVISGISMTLQFLSPAFFQIWQWVVVALYLLIIPFFIYSARRYILSRTKWRGIRFGLSRVRSEYIQAFFVGSLVTFLTLGLAIPWARLRTHKILTEATMYGGVAMKFQGTHGDYVRIYLKALFLIPLTLGIYFPWFSAELTRYNFSKTTFDGATMKMDIKGGDLFGIYLLTVFISLITLGFGIPWATVYQAKYLAEKFSLDGPIDFEKLQQMAPSADAMADSMVDYFDLDLGW